jgi:hypothetical protein
MNDRATLNYGLRYEYYTPLRERDNLYVVINPTTGLIEDPASRDPFRTQKDNFLPRVSTTYALDRDAKTVLRGGVGLLVGPGQTEDQIQPIESDRVASTISGGAFPVNRRRSSPTSRTTRTIARISRVPIRPTTTCPNVCGSTACRCSANCREGSPELPRMSAARGGTCSCAASRTRSSTCTPTEPDGQRHRRSRVRHRPGRRIDSASLRRSGHEDERRARYLQRAAAFGRPPLQRRPHDELAVHLRPQLRQHGRAERGGDVRQQRRRSRRLRLRHRLQHLRRAPHVQRERAFIRFCSAAAASSAATRAS